MDSVDYNNLQHLLLGHDQNCCLFTLYKIFNYESINNAIS